MMESDIARRATALHVSAFGAPPVARAAAPGRVNLIGEHTDYNDGFVLPMAIDRHTVCAGRITHDGQVSVISSGGTLPATFALTPEVTTGEPRWSNYVRGVIAGFQRHGARLTGLQIAVESDLPIGGGLSSSAALEVATATLLEALTDLSLAPTAKIALARQAEHEFAGVPCGIMDQSIVVLAQAGHALLIDCRTGVGTPVAMADPDVAVLVINTNVRHHLETGEYARRRAECEAAAQHLGLVTLRDADAAQLAGAAPTIAPLILRRARHVVSENARTIRAAQALSTGDWGRMGGLMYDSHASLRDDFEVSCAELDAVVDIAQSLGRPHGVWGCRMTGGGFGGCAVALVRRDAVSDLSERIGAAYLARTGRAASIFATGPAAGARVLPG